MPGKSHIIGWMDICEKEIINRTGMEKCLSWIYHIWLMGPYIGLSLYGRHLLSCSVPHTNLELV